MKARPSNAPIRIAGRVNDATASKQVLGLPGAERLLGQGDMLMVVGGATPVRFQACLTVEADWARIRRVEQLELGASLAGLADRIAVHPGHVRGDDSEAIAWALANGHDGGPASASAIQRQLGVGMDRARRIRDAALAALPPYPPTGDGEGPVPRLIQFPAGRAVGQ